MTSYRPLSKTLEQALHRSHFFLIKALPGHAVARQRARLTRVLAASNAPIFATSNALAAVFCLTCERLCAFSDNRSLPFHWHFSVVLRSPGLLLLQRLQAARAQPHERLDYAHDDGHKPAPGS
jgi:hypothetical protein